MSAPPLDVPTDQLPLGPDTPDVDPTGKEALAIAAGFLTVRGLMASDLLSRHVDARLIADPGEAVQMSWRAQRGLWLRLVGPAFERLYELGSHGNLSPDQVHQLALHYAAGLGDDLAMTSAAALTEGFHRQLDARWSENVAWQRVIAAYGLDRPRLLSWLGAVLREPDKEGKRNDGVLARIARGTVDQLLLARATTIGENEAWRGYQSARVLTWSWLESQGLLTAGSMKGWRTARDERTCPVCAELDGQVVALGEPFVYADGTQIFAPPAHPRCRCNADLVQAPEELEKLAKADWDAHEHPRGQPTNRGQFVRLAERQAAPAPAKPKLQPTLQPLLQPTLAPSLLATPVLAEVKLTAPTRLAAPTRLQQRQATEQGAPARAETYFVVRRGDPRSRFVAAAQLEQLVRDSDGDLSVLDGLPTEVGQSLDLEPINAQIATWDHAYAEELVHGAVHSREGHNLGLPEAEDAAFYASEERRKLLWDVQREVTQNAQSILDGGSLEDVDITEILTAAGHGNVAALGSHSHNRRLVYDALDETIGFTDSRRDPDTPPFPDSQIARSISEAFIDYVSYVEPGKSGGSHGRQLRQEMAEAGYSPVVLPYRDVYVFDALNLTPAAIQGNRVAPVGKYHVRAIDYASTRDPNQPSQAPLPGIAGYRMIYLTPGEGTDPGHDWS